MNSQIIVRLAPLFWGAALALSGCPEPSPTQDAGGEVDAGAIDAARSDATAPDTSGPDSAPPDSAAPEAAVPDRSAPDTTVLDTTAPDAAALDVSTQDIPSTDTLLADAGASDADSGVREEGWARSWSSSQAAFRAPLAVDGQGDVYVGVNAPNNGATGFELVKLTPAGEVLDSWGFGGGEPTLHAIAIDITDAVYLLGECEASCDLDPGPEVRLLELDADGAFVAKLSAQGQLDWATGWEGVRVFNHGRIALRGDRALAIAGHYEGSPDLDPEGRGGLLPQATAEDAFVASFSAADGAYLWSRGFGGNNGDYARAVAIDSNGAVLVGGSFHSDAVDFDPGAAEVIGVQRGISTAFVARYTQTGQLIIVNTWGASMYTEVYDLFVGEDNRPYAIGQISGPAGEVVDFNPSGDPITLTIAANADAFIARYSSGLYLTDVASIAGGSDDWFISGTRCGDLGVRVVGRTTSSDVDLLAGPDERLTAGDSSLLMGYSLDLTWQGGSAWGPSGGHTLDIACDDLGNAYVSGVAEVGVELAPVHAPCAAAPTPHGSSGAYLIKLLPDGCW